MTLKHMRDIRSTSHMPLLTVLLSYWTAWLKYYYPLEFMFALLKNEKDKDARTEYLIEAKAYGYFN
jgi:hypothetical protein